MRDIFVVSDLHLNEGVKSQHEDFFYDDEFADFLRYCHETDRKSTLVINGDFVDFLQVTSIDETRFPASTREKAYGLGTEPEKSAWKLRKVKQAHKTFFHALDDFASAGHHVHILLGNHDAEFHWPEVQEELKSGMRGHRRLHVQPWFYHEKKRLWVEHGNQYDEHNSFRHLLRPVLPDNHRQLMLPFGSFFVRYFFNKIEYWDSLADNFKPSSSYAKHILWKKPWQSIRLVRRYLPFLVNTLRKANARFSAADWAAIRIEDETAAALECARGNVPRRIGQEIRRLWAVPVLEQPDAWKRIFLAPDVTRDHYHRIAAQIRTALKLPLVVMGHTHDAEQQRGYCNTGTWTTLVSPKTMKTKTVLSYVHVTGTNGRVKVWDAKIKK